MPIDDDSKPQKSRIPSFLEKIVGPVVVATILGTVGFGVNAWRTIDSFEHSLGEHTRVHLRQGTEYDEFKKSVRVFMAGSGNRFTNTDAKELRIDILTTIRLEMRLLEAKLLQRISNVEAGVPPREVRDALVELRRQQDLLSWQMSQIQKNKLQP